LSPRLIHFGRDQLLWECTEKAAAEICPSGFPNGIAGVDIKREMIFLAPNYNRVISNQAPKSYYAWERIVREYSDTQLTKITDKLVALSGLAKRMKVILDDDYVAGMWRHALPEQLFWTSRYQWHRSPISYGDISRRSATYVAPTWSWASAIHAVMFGVATIQKVEVQVVDIYLDHFSEDPTGAITSGYLDLKGWLRPVSFLRIAEAENATSWVRWQITSCEDLEDDYWKGAENFESLVFFDDDQRRHEAETKTKSFYCMLGGSRNDQLHITLMCLLLEMVDQVQGVYERVGMATIKCERDPEGTIEDTLNRFKAPVTGTAIPCRCYSEGGYTIRIR